jgi:hypothetical protein
VPRGLGAASLPSFSRHLAAAVGPSAPPTEFTFETAGTWHVVNNLDKTKSGIVTVR